MQFHYAVSNSVGKIRQKPAAGHRRHRPDDGMAVDRPRTGWALRRPEIRDLHFFNEEIAK